MRDVRDAQLGHRGPLGRACCTLLALALLAGCAAGGTFAYLTSKSDTYVNTFTSGLPTLGDLTGLVTVEGDKALVGRDWREGDSFEFVLEHAVADADGAVEWVALGDGPATVAYDPDSEGFDAELFDEFDLTEAIAAVQMEAGETHGFRIREVVPAGGAKIPGVSYDLAKHHFDVTVADADGDGALEIASIAVPEGESASEAADTKGESGPQGSSNADGGEPGSTAGEPGSQDGGASDSDSAEQPFFEVKQAEDGTWSVIVHFENSYSASGTAQAVIGIEKTLEDLSGQGMAPAGFSFELYEDDIEEGELPVRTVETLSTGEAQIVLEYGAEDAGKVFEYTLVEANAGEIINGMAYDPVRYEIKVQVIDNLDGTLSVVISDIEQDEEPGEGEKIGSDQSAADTPANEYLAVFANVYDPDDVELTLSGTKALIGADIAGYAGKFEFDLYEADASFAVADGAQPVDSAPNDAAGAFAFDELAFGEVGTYRYVVIEDAASPLDNVTYDGTAFGITVTVADNGKGALTASVEYVEITEAGKAQANGIAFENAYSDSRKTPDPEPEPVPDPDNGETPNIPGGSSTAQTGDALPATTAALAVLAIAAAATTIIAFRRMGDSPNTK